MGARGGTPEEIAGFAEAMRHVAKTLPLTDAERDELVDTCGTGGDASGTFNISTAAALVAAAAGAKVAKHGNRAVTSTCGSADVLEALGIPTALEGEAAADALRAHGFVFLLAPAHHPAMKAVMPVRRALGVRSVFNVLGPLLNPAGARRQVMGVYAGRLVQTVAAAMALLDTRNALVVHGDQGLDELSLSGPSMVAEVVEGGVQMRTIAPEELGLERAPLEALQCRGTGESAEVLRRVFAGERGPRRDVVLLNAGAVLMVAGLAGTLSAGVELAAETIDAGRVRELVAGLSA
jgi:anthranilate phosphoribosyltransferase